MAQTHTSRHPLAGTTVTVKAGQKFRVEDWWDRVGGFPWNSTRAADNWACKDYAARVGDEQLPRDDEVLYGKVGPYGKLIHASQLGDA
jgi:hypothetical protein